MKNPFQSANLHALPWWRGIRLHDDKNAVFQKLTAELESAFSRALDGGSLNRFKKEYSRVAQAMIGELPEESLLPAILGHAYRRLVTLYCYGRQRSNSQLRLLTAESSIVRWEVPRDALREASEQADRMQQSGVTHQKFDLKSSPPLVRWLRGNYWPLVRGFSGLMAVPILDAHIRCMSFGQHANGYQERFRFHRFGNHHYDEDVYSLPLIIYLSDVSEESGPFEYLSSADKYRSNPVLRAFHQALNHDCRISPLEEGTFSIIGRLPAVFRGGDVFGNLYSSAEFERAGPTAVMGRAGTAVMFDGFNVIHSGGLPSAGSRKSLFVNFRFPVAKIVTRTRLAFAPPPPLSAGR